MPVVGSLADRMLVPDAGSAGFRREPITRNLLVRFRTRGLRRRVWFWALDRIERGLVDLTIRWVDKVRSGQMTETLMRILEKLERALETGMGRVLGRGRELAARASALAVEWGNKQAFQWRLEQDFWRALGLGLVS